MTELASKTCVPCRGGVPPMPPEEVAALRPQIPDWTVVDNHHLRRELEFPDFAQALAAVQRIGELAEEQGHHPELHLGWGHVEIEVWTHKIDGLTESDFVLAAKIDEIT